MMVHNLQRADGVSRCSTCHRTYEEHLRDEPLHVYQGFVWLPQDARDA